jgi:hypothetical protein
VPDAKITDFSHVERIVQKQEGVCPEPRIIALRREAIANGWTTATYSTHLVTTIRGIHGASARWDDETKDVLDAVIKKFRARKRREDLTADDLWDDFIGDLDVKGILITDSTDPNEPKKSFVKFGSPAKPRRMTFGTFQNRLSDKSR